MDRNWMQAYEMLKQQVRTKRQNSVVAPPSEVNYIYCKFMLIILNILFVQIKEYNVRLSELALQLKTMASSPMEYEV